MVYKTKQKQAIITYLEANVDKYVSISDISSYLKEHNNAVGTTTIYRYIDTLMKQGKIQKVMVNEDNTTYYLYVKCNNDNEHFHLKCDYCGKLIHLGCDTLNAIQNHLTNNHQFNINISKTIIYGKCEACNYEQ